MSYKNHVRIPNLSVLRQALEYNPENQQQPLKCNADFEKYREGQLLGFKARGVWLVKIGRGQTYLKNIVWRVVEGYVPRGFRIEQIESVDDNRIENLFLVGKDGELRLPKSVSHCQQKIVAISREFAAEEDCQTTYRATGSDEPTQIQSCYSGETPPWAH